MVQVTHLSSELTRHSRGGDRGKGGSIGLGNGGGSSSDHGGSCVSVGGVVVGYWGVVVGQGGCSVSGVSIQVRCGSHDGLGLFSEANCQNGGENELKRIIFSLVWSAQINSV